MNMMWADHIRSRTADVVACEPDAASRHHIQLFGDATAALAEQGTVVYGVDDNAELIIDDDAVGADPETVDQASRAGRALIERKGRPQALAAMHRIVQGTGDSAVMHQRMVDAINASEDVEERQALLRFGTAAIAANDAGSRLHVTSDGSVWASLATRRLILVHQAQHAAGSLACLRGSDETSRRLGQLVDV